MTRDRGGQAPLVHRPGTGGIWRSLQLPDGTVNAAPWLAALAAGDLVGTCRECGGYLATDGQPYRTGGVDWYPARCVGKAPADPCGHFSAASGPRPKPKQQRTYP